MFSGITRLQHTVLIVSATSVTWHFVSPCVYNSMSDVYSGEATTAQSVDLTEDTGCYSSPNLSVSLNGAAIFLDGVLSAFFAKTLKASRFDASIGKKGEFVEYFLL